MKHLSLDHDAEVVTVVFESPILTRETLSELADTLETLSEAGAPAPIVLVSAHPTIFLAGAHLGEIAALDPHSCIAYAKLGRSVADALGSHPAPVVAAVAGSCSGGGFDLVMACDAIIASPEAVFSHPGVKRGLVTGWGGTERLARTLGTPHTRKALLEGAEFDAKILEQFGAIRRIGPDPVKDAQLIARELSQLHPSRIAIWRRLRSSNFVDRFRAFVVEKS